MKEKINFKDIGKAKWILLGIAGIMLILCSYFENIGNYSKEEETTIETVKTNEDYQKKIEGKLQKIIGSLKGVGKVEVMITLKSTTEKVVKEDEDVASSSKSSGTEGSGSDNTSSRKSTTVILEQNGEEKPYIVMENYPLVEGIAVTAQGVTDLNVTNKIISMLQALFNVEAHKISVLEMN